MSTWNTTDPPAAGTYLITYDCDAGRLVTAARFDGGPRTGQKRDRERWRHLGGGGHPDVVAWQPLPPAKLNGEGRVRFVSLAATKLGHPRGPDDRPTCSETLGYSWDDIEIVCTMEEITGTTRESEHLREWLACSVATRRPPGGRLRIEVV